MNKQLNKLTNLLVLISFGFQASASFAEEFSSQNQKNLASLGQMAGLHARKVCAHRSGNARSRCEAEQIKSLAETAASVPALRPANISPGEFAAMIENQAGAKQREAWQSNSSYGSSEVDCRINVC